MGMLMKQPTVLNLNGWTGLHIVQPGQDQHKKQEQDQQEEDQEDQEEQDQEEQAQEEQEDPSICFIQDAHFSQFLFQGIDIEKDTSLADKVMDYAKARTFRGVLLLDGWRLVSPEQEAGYKVAIGQCAGSGYVVIAVKTPAPQKRRDAQMFIKELTKNAEAKMTVISFNSRMSNYREQTLTQHLKDVLASKGEQSKRVAKPMIRKARELLQALAREGKLKDFIRTVDPRQRQARTSEIVLYTDTPNAQHHGSRHKGGKKAVA